jgi:hypothetical protein
MLETFIYRNNIDILLVQEVTNVNIQYLRGCTCYINIGTTQRGTALIVKDPLTLSDVTMLTSGRGIAAKCKGLWIVNIYAPSGAAYKREREDFFNTGETNRSRNLENLIAGYTLIDAWQAHPARQIFTHYTQHGTARLDRIYISWDLQAKKTSAVTLFAPFTDHLAMSVTITLPETMVRRGNALWKMNITLLKERSFKEEIIACVSQWRAQIRRYKTHSTGGTVTLRSTLKDCPFDTGRKKTTTRTQTPTSSILVSTRSFRAMQVSGPHRPH